MGRTIYQDMYEGNAARQIREGYGEPVYNRSKKAAESRSRQMERREPGYGGGSRYMENGRHQAVWKEPVHEGRSRRTGNARPETVRREPVRESRRTSGDSARKSAQRRKKKIQRKILRGLCFYFLLAGVLATCWVIISFFFGREEKVHAEGTRQADGGMVQDAAFAEGFMEEEAGSGTDGTGSGGASLEVTPEIRQECQELYAGQEDLLILVNKDNELSASYSPGLHSICKGRLEAADVLYDDLCAMLEAGGDAGYQYWIASAHRDRAYQQGLVDEDVQKYMAKGYSYEAALQKTYEYTMPAGQSEHETGLALDILCSTNTIMDESQKGEPGNQWLAQHCHEYGFILRYPEDKADITGIEYEPWHFRYVGREAAAYLTKMGWTLEEYYEVLRGGV